MRFATSGLEFDAFLPPPPPPPLPRPPHTLIPYASIPAGAPHARGPPTTNPTDEAL